MNCVPYAGEEDFLSLVPDKDYPGDEAMRTASRHIDSLTFNRIPAAGGLDGLTEFQRELVREVVCRQALFEEENADTLGSALSSYAINGVSMQFGESWNVYVQDGVAMQRDTYATLAQSGLCCRRL